MLKSNEVQRENQSRWLWVFLALVPFIAIPILGSLFYFRHDDASVLLWAKEFTKPFYFAFSHDLNANEYYKYPGMGAYWRPCIYLYVKLLWLLFGANPTPYFIVGGIVFMTAVYFLFKIAEDISGTGLAFLSCLFLFVTFQNMMYNLFHLTTEIAFFYQLGMIYFFLSYLIKEKWGYLLGVIIFLLPAMARQTTPLILTTLLIVTTLSQTAKKNILSLKHGIILIILIICFYIMTLSPIIHNSTVFSLFPDVPQMLTFIYERFLYYGAILTSGLVGIIIVSGFTFGFIHHFAAVVKNKLNFNKWAWSILAIIMVVLLLLFKNIAMYWLAFTIIYLFMFDEKLRLPLGWAGASLLSFLSASYYHNGYLLEAGFPLSLALGTIVTTITAPYMPLLSTIKKKNSRRKLIFIVSGVLIGCFLVIGIGSRSNFIQKKIGVVDVVKIGIDSNRNFKQLMDYLQQKIPQNAIIYELSEEEIGTTLFDRRFLPLRERALRTKTMNIEDTLVMLKVLNRSDIHLYPSSESELSAQNGEKYLIALNNFERKIVEYKFKLELIKEFKANNDSAAVYQIAR